MPLPRHRQTLAALAVALVALLAVLTPAGASSDHPIVARAIRDLGTYQGDCWPWVKRVVFEATGHEIGFDYRLGFLEAGAIEVSAEEAAPGDIIQVARDSWTSPDADYPGLHTAIIIANRGGGVFDAIDSNQQWDGIVRLRDGYRPYAQAAAYGLQVYIYRFPAAGSEPSLSAPGPDGFAPGDTARVNTPGDCLRLRSAPGGDILACLADGTRVTVLEGPARVLGIEWYRASTPAGTGWMAGSFLLKVHDPAANPSAQGPTKPLLHYRAIVPLAAVD